MTKHIIMMAVTWTMLIIWAVALPSSMMLGLALVCKSVVLMGVTNESIVALSSITTPALSSIVLLVINLFCICSFCIVMIKRQETE